MPTKKVGISVQIVQFLYIKDITHIKNQLQRWSNVLHLRQRERAMHIPRAICFQCEAEMKIFKTGILVEGIARFGSYYKIYCDVYYCIVCESKISMPAHKAAYVHNEKGYDNTKADYKFVFADE